MIENAVLAILIGAVVALAYIPTPPGAPSVALAIRIGFHPPIR